MNFVMLSAFVFGLFVTSQATEFCEPNPCQNGGVCLETSDSYKCDCPLNFVGIHCTLPPPEVVCGKRAIEIKIDERIVTEMNLPPNEEFVYFEKSPGCRAVKNQDQYHLRIDAPFLDCGLSLEAEEENFIFSQKVVWNKPNGEVERPVVLLNFRCNYSGRYNVSFESIKPTVTTIDFETTYGEFTLQMDLYKSSDFAENEKFRLRPVVTINEEVCVKNKINGGLPDKLVLTSLQCWASSEEDGDGSYYGFIDDKCLEDQSTAVIINNGDSAESKFCFDVFKWKNSENSVYVNCKVRVCNTTWGPDNCVCSKPTRQTRSLDDDDSAYIVSPKILVFENNHLNSWMDFLENESENYEAYEKENDLTQEMEQNNKSNKTTTLLVVGIILVLIIVGLGILIGVVLSYRKKARKV